MYLLDSDWVIQAISRRQPATRILDHLATSRIHVSYVTAGELCERAFWSAHPQAYVLGYQHFLSAYGMLGLTHQIMARFAELRFYLRRRGQLILDFDLVIAATALQYDLTLLTFNLRHFQRIPDLRLYEPG